MSATVTYIGAADGAAATMAEERALYLKIFAGEVLTAFEEKTMFIDKHQVRAITKGKEAQFPLIGRMPPAAYHTPGTELLGQEAPMAEKTISVDRVLVSHLFIDNLDEKLAHFQARGQIATNMGTRLSQTFDNHVARNIVAAASAASPITGDTTMGGLVITDDDLKSAVAATKLAGWTDAIVAAKTNFDNKWVNDGTIYLAMLPADYYFLVMNAMASGYSLVDQRIGGAGSISQGKITEFMGVQLLSFPGIPTADYGAEAFHNVDCSLVKALCWTKGAVGTVKVFDVAIETEYKVNYQGTLTVAKSAMGHGVLQGECAVAFKTAS